MASNIKFKRSSVQNRVPTTAQLDLGELALNTYDGKLYTEINTGSAAVVEIGSKLSSLVVDGDNGAGGGDVTFHGQTAGRDVTWDYSANRLEFADNAIASFGDNADLRIYHTGSHSYISDFVTGDLRLTSDNVKIKNNLDSETMAVFDADGAVDLYHNNLLRISTTADGADISGTGSLKVPVGTTAQRNSSPAAGDIRYNSTLGAFEGYSSSWGELGGGGIGIGSTSTNPASGVVANRIGVGFTDINVVGSGISVTGYGSTIVLDFNDFKPGSFNRSIHNYTATAGQTTFGGLSYDNAERQIAVYLNGARLSEATYTATSGTTVVLDVGASVGDEVEIINININSDVDRNVNTYTATAGQTTFTGLSYNSITELDVYLNGIRLATGDYTATTGNTVVLNVGASVNDIVDIVSTGDGVSFRSTADTSGDKFTLTNVGIGTDVTPDKLNVTGNVNIVGVLTATTLHGDGSNLTNTGSTLSQPSSGTQRLVTTSLTSGTMTSSGTGSELTFDYANNLLKLTDSTKINLGTGGDLFLFHDGSNSFLQDAGTGTLFLDCSQTQIKKFGSNHVMANFIGGGAVELYHNNSQKLATFSGGISVTGQVNSDGSHMGDGDKALFGNSNDLQIYHSSNVNFIDSPSHEVRIRGTYVALQPNGGGAQMALGTAGGSFAIFHNGNQKLETTSNGVNVTGTTDTDGLVVSGISTVSGSVEISGHGALVGTPHKYFYGRGGTQAGGLSIHAMESSLELVSSEDSTHGGSILLRTVTDGVGLVYNSSTNALEFNFFTPSSDHFAVHGGGTNLSSIDTQLRIVKDGAVELYYNGGQIFRTESTGIVVSGNVRVPFDGHKILLGASQDLQIYHDGSHSYIDDVGTGNLKVRSNNFRVSNADESKISATFVPSGAVELYHNNSKKFETTSTGASITGNLSVSGVLTYDDVTNVDSVGIITARDDIKVVTDNKSIIFGASSDLSMKHDGSNSYILNNTGNFIISADDLQFNNRANTEVKARFLNNSSVELYFDNSKKFNTTSTGATITGTCNMTSLNCTTSGSTGANFTVGGDLNVTGHIDVADNVRIKLGTSDDLQLYHDGTSSILNVASASPGGLFVQSDDTRITNAANSETIARFIADGAVELYHNGSKKFETQSTGAKVTGTLHTSSNVRISGELDLGTANGNKFMDVCLGDNYGFYLRSTSGEGANHEALARFERNRGAILYWDANTRFETTSAGVSITGNLDLPDNTSGNASLRLGNSQDFFMNHNGTDSFIINNTGNLYIRDLNGDVHIQGKDAEESIIAKADGAVELYYNNGKKAETTSSGIDVNGTITCNDIITAGALLHEGDTNTLVHFDANDQISLKTNGSTRLQVVNAGINVTGNIELSTHLDMPDNAIIKLGTGDDLQLYHDGSNSYIKDAGTGGIYIDTSFLHVRQGSGESMINAVADAQVELYYNNNGVFETIERGIKVENSSGNSEIRCRGTGGNRADVMILQTGTNDANLWLDASNGDLAGADYANIKHETSTLDLSFINYANDIKMYVRGGSIGAGGLRQAFHAHENGAVDLYHNGNLKLSTVSNGCKIEGGHGDGLEIENGGTNLAAQFKLKNTTVNRQYTIGVAGNTGVHGQNSSLSFIDQTASTTRFELTSSGHLIPGQDNTYDLGTSSRRWRYIYTTDLQLSNENTGGNEVDGTEGAWTLQEGEDDIYMINRKNGKRYKIKMEEV